MKTVVVLLFVGAFASCNVPTPTVEDVVNDSTKVDSIVVDSVKTDTLNINPINLK